MSRRGWIVIAAVVGVWVVVLALVGVVAIGALSGFGGGPGDWSEEVVRGEGIQKIAMIDVRGEIHGGESETGPFAGESAGARDVISQLRQAADDPDVAGVILRIDSPGGAVVASDEIYSAVRRILADKPVVSSMADLAASGGYYIAAATDTIVANPATLTGSIGVIMVVPNLQEAANKLGIGVAVIKSGAFKDAGSPFRPLEPAERDHFQSLIDEAYQRFVDAVATGRDMPAERVREIADGRVYSGSQAAELGLVDELGDLDRAYEVVLEAANLDEDAARLVRYASGGGGLESLFSPFAKTSSPVEEVKREFGVGFGLKYLYLP